MVSASYSIPCVPYLMMRLSIMMSLLSALPGPMMPPSEMVYFFSTCANTLDLSLGCKDGEVITMDDYSTKELGTIEYAW